MSGDADLSLLARELTAAKEAANQASVAKGRAHDAFAAALAERDVRAPANVRLSGGLTASVAFKKPKKKKSERGEGGYQVTLENVVEELASRLRDAGHPETDVNALALEVLEAASAAPPAAGSDDEDGDDGEVDEDQETVVTIKGPKPAQN